eukprot:scaffold721_cov131-Cylindrotheca_fusiformis.AAC.22
MDRKKVLHIEVAVKPLCPTQPSRIKEYWEECLGATTVPPAVLNDRLEIDLSKLPTEIQQSCLKAYIIDDDNDQSCFTPGDSFLVHTFVLSQEEACTEELEPTGGDDEYVSASDSLALPHASLDNLWESLIFESSMKRQLLEYAQSALIFSDKKVSSHIISWNRILLLHGPPGTGKTSLCRALANKLAIRLNHRFPRATLLEIHSHSLFSKWFSTSGKLVSSLFQMVKDMVQSDSSELICVLIDEVESLAASRDSGSSGDPSDAMRAVNSLLTSLDKLRPFPNVLVMATTNLHLTGTVDAAFVDRCDLLVHVPMPPEKARYQILLSCMTELVRVGIVLADDESVLVPYSDLSGLQSSSSSIVDTPGYRSSLLGCAHTSEGLSGRSLRRLPLQAHAKYVDTAEGPPTCTKFVEALFLAISHEQAALAQVRRG